MNIFHIYYNKYEKGNISEDVYHLMGDKQSIANIYYLLTGMRENTYTNVVVRETAIKIVDMSKGLADMSLYSNNCFIPQDKSMMGFLNKQDSIAYLGISEEEFDRYDAKTLILYTLKNGQRWYPEDDLDRFKR